MKLNRVSDYFFKYLLGNEQNKQLSLHFINSALGNGQQLFTDVEFLNKDMDPVHLGNKLVKLDIRAKVNTGQQIEIEMQVCSYKFMVERSLYYWSKMYSSQLPEGEKYSRLKPCISVSMLDFELLKDAPEWYNIYMLRAKNLESPLTDHQKMIFLELPKLEKKLESTPFAELSPIEQWGAYFTGKVGNAEMEAIPIMKSALEAESKFTENERMMYINDMREKAIRDYYSGMEDAKEEGIAIGVKRGREEGREQGREEGRAEGVAIGAEETSKKKDAETVKLLLIAGMDNAFIKTIVHSYTDEAIDAIRKELA